TLPSSVGLTTSNAYVPAPSVTPGNATERLNVRYVSRSGRVDAATDAAATSNPSANPSTLRDTRMNMTDSPCCAECAPGWTDRTGRFLPMGTGGTCPSLSPESLHGEQVRDHAADRATTRAISD